MVPLTGPGAQTRFGEVDPVVLLSPGPLRGHPRTCNDINAPTLTALVNSGFVGWLGDRDVEDGDRRGDPLEVLHGSGPVDRDVWPRPGRDRQVWRRANLGLLPPSGWLLAATRTGDDTETGHKIHGDTYMVISATQPSSSDTNWGDNSWMVMPLAAARSPMSSLDTPVTTSWPGVGLVEVALRAASRFARSSDQGERTWTLF